MLNVYWFLQRGLSDPVYVLARDSREALASFWVWRERNRPDLVNGEVHFNALDDLELAQRPEVANLRFHWVPGIAWWIGKDAGWVVVSPDSDQLGRLAPLRTPLKCFLVHPDEDMGTVYVCAEDLDEAQRIYQVHCRDCMGEEGDFANVRALDRAELTGALATLAEDMDDGFTGVGMLCEDGKWRVFPPDYDPPLGKRDV